VCRCVTLALWPKCCARQLPRPLGEEYAHTV
jgi:hypothetical protein